MKQRQCSRGLTLKNVKIMQQTLKKLCKLAAPSAAAFAGGVASEGAGFSIAQHPLCCPNPMPSNFIPLASSTHA